MIMVVHLMGVYLIGMHLSVCLIGVYLPHGRALRVPHRRVRYGHAPHWHASLRRVPRGRASQDASVYT